MNSEKLSSKNIHPTKEVSPEESPSSDRGFPQEQITFEPTAFDYQMLMTIRYDSDIPPDPLIEDQAVCDPKVTAAQNVRVYPPFFIRAVELAEPYLPARRRRGRPRRKRSHPEEPGKLRGRQNGDVVEMREKARSTSKESRSVRDSFIAVNELGERRKDVFDGQCLNNPSEPLDVGGGIVVSDGERTATPETPLEQDRSVTLYRFQETDGIRDGEHLANKPMDFIDENFIVISDSEQPATGDSLLDLNRFIPVSELAEMSKKRRNTLDESAESPRKRKTDQSKDSQTEAAGVEGRASEQRNVRAGRSSLEESGTAPRTEEQQVSAIPSGDASLNFRMKELGRQLVRQVEARKRANHELTLKKRAETALARQLVRQIFWNQLNPVARSGESAARVPCSGLGLEPRSECFHCMDDKQRKNAEAALVRRMINQTAKGISFVETFKEIQSMVVPCAAIVGVEDPVVVRAPNVHYQDLMNEQQQSQSPVAHQLSPNDCSMPVLPVTSSAASLPQTALAQQRVQQIILDELNRDARSGESAAQVPCSGDGRGPHCMDDRQRKNAEASLVQRMINQTSEGNSFVETVKEIQSIVEPCTASRAFEDPVVETSLERATTGYVRYEDLMKEQQQSRSLLIRQLLTNDSGPPVLPVTSSAASLPQLALPSYSVAFNQQDRIGPGELVGTQGDQCGQRERNFLMPQCTQPLYPSPALVNMPPRRNSGHLWLPPVPHHPYYGPPIGQLPQSHSSIRLPSSGHSPNESLSPEGLVCSSPLSAVHPVHLLPPSDIPADTVDIMDHLLDDLCPEFPSPVSLYDETRIVQLSRKDDEHEH